MLMLEAMLMAALGAALGVALLYAGLLIARPFVDAAYGLYLTMSGLTPRDGVFLMALIVAAALVSLLPALRAYRLSLADGMTVRN
jgi:putative ABC transport system permease protein